jgi:hypothetical protein
VSRWGEPTCRTCVTTTCMGRGIRSPTAITVHNSWPHVDKLDSQSKYGIAWCSVLWCSELLCGSVPTVSVHACDALFEKGHECLHHPLKLGKLGHKLISHSIAARRHCDSSSSCRVTGEQGWQWHKACGQLLRMQSRSLRFTVGHMSSLQAAGTWNCARPKLCVMGVCMCVGAMRDAHGAAQPSLIDNTSMTLFSTVQSTARHGARSNAVPIWHMPSRLHMC